MGNLKQVFSQRLRYFGKEIAKYGRLIVNDHFSVIALVLLAFGAIYYRELLMSLIDNAEEMKGVVGLIVAVLLAATFSFGRPMWLTKEADKAYLFARGQEWHSYWFRGALISCVVPLIILIGVTVLMGPLLDVVGIWSLDNLVWLVMFLVILRLASQLLAYLDIYSMGLSRWIGPALSTRWVQSSAVALSLWLSFTMNDGWRLAILLAVVCVVVAYVAWVWLKRESQGRLMDFEGVVASERLRETTFYKWIALFADVPSLGQSVKRRRYLDNILTLLPTLSSDRYSYLFVRAVLRNNAYNGIWVRVMAFISVVMLVVTSPWLMWALGAIGHVLTLAQLLPLMIAYDYHPFQQLYPERGASVVKAFQQVMGLIFLIQTLVYTAVCVLTQGATVEVGIAVAIWGVVAGVLLVAYVPYWYQAQLNKR